VGNFTNKLRKEAETLERNPDLKGQQIQDILMSLKMSSGHIHRVLPGKEVTKELIEDLQTETAMPVRAPESNQPPAEIIFKNRQAIGDILTFTCAVRDFKNQFPNTRVGVISTARHIWDNNPYIDHQFVSGIEPLDVGPGFLTNRSNTWNLHMCNAFRMDIEQKLGLSIVQGPVKPDIWMTQEEMARKPIIDGDYWIFIYGGEPGWPAKQYHRWQEVIDILVKDGIRVVQLGVKGHPYPILDGVIDYVGKTQDGKTGVRDLFNIFLHSNGSLGLVSMHMHLSAAFNNPAVVVAGAREPSGFTNYVNHQYISTNGTLKCAQKACWCCKLEGCKDLVDGKIPKCVDIIDPEEIAEGVRKYYRGGFLTKGKNKEITFSNIVKEKKEFIIPEHKPIDEDLLKEYGFKWGGNSVTDKDWIFIKESILKHKIKTVLEFGVELSSLLISNFVDNIVTYETNSAKITEFNALKKDNHEIRHWDGKVMPELGNYDMIFVDGPVGGPQREWSVKFASEHSETVIVHDAGRDWERKWQDKYMKESFQETKGGHRCSLWRRKEVIKLDDTKPLARMMTTCRGYGGSEKSTLFIMQGLVERGYNVELVSTGNICNPYQNSIPEGVIERDMEYLSQPCDLLVLYCSDTIWNYHLPEYEVMNNLNAKRKVMVVNFKLGKVGEVEWTKGWDKYLFLNSTHEADLIKRMPDITTKALCPPTDLEDYYAVEPKYDGPLRIIRHSSQRDAKWPEDSNEFIEKILEILPETQFFFMPARSDCIDHPNVHKFKVNEMKIPEFLAQGNVFLYSVPIGYTEGGPRVLAEAMAAGLSVICDNHTGMKDRVDVETGWRCDTKDQMIEIIKSLTPTTLEMYGKRARKRALEHFNPMSWIEEIIK